MSKSKEPTKAAKSAAPSKPQPKAARKAPKNGATGRVLTPQDLKARERKPTKVKPKLEAPTKVVGASIDATGSETEAPQSKRGRPSKFTPELARTICLRIAAGESVRAICEDENMPSESTVRAWAVDDLEGFSAQYTRAIQIRAMGWADEIVEISDDGRNDTFIDDNGNERTDNERVARSRLRVDSRKWMLSKMLPKVYGDKLDVNHGVQPDNPLASLIQRVAGSGLPIKGHDE